MKNAARHLPPLFVALTLLAALACLPVERAHAPATTGEDCADGETARAAEAWLRIVPYETSEVRDEPPLDRPRSLARRDGREYRAILSYPDAQNGLLANRSFIYDNALALLWTTWADRRDAAAGLAETLMLLQNKNGSWGFSFTVTQPGRYNARYVRNGVVGWTTYALAVYADATHSARAAAAAERGTRYLESERVAQRERRDYALIHGGYGWWKRGDKAVFHPDRKFSLAVAEHQFDAYQAWSFTRPGDAEAYARRILEALWLPDEKRFALAVDDKNLDTQRALDTAGAWGALWLESIGERSLARASLQYTMNHFATEAQGWKGYRPYLDPIDGPLTPEWDSLIFVEGTLGVGLAAYRQGRRDAARDVLTNVAAMACAYGPGVPYANKELMDFSTLPSASATLWFLFLEREMRTGKRSPLFTQKTRINYE
ncbi:MAG TPA: hypothetical protein PKW95_03120 [bacterium]|nr:hypothetical protein [bacterium]